MHNEIFFIMADNGQLNYALISAVDFENLNKMCGGWNAFNVWMLMDLTEIEP